MRYVLFALCLSLMAGGVAAEDAAAVDEKATTCALQAEVVGAIQEARLNRVRRDRVIDRLMQENTAWPATMAQAMPALVDWIYDQRRRDLRNVDLGAVSRQQCLENWDQLKALSN